jgi:hypothetical protein
MRDPRDQPPSDPRRRRESLLIRSEAIMLGIILLALIASFVLPA